VVVNASTGANGFVSITYTPPPFSTSTAVTCGAVGQPANTVAVGQPATCTATVTDTEAGITSTPTGTVNFESNGAGSFGHDECTLGQTSPGVARCSVTYTPSATGSQTISAFYDGDAIHGKSESPGETLTVTRRSSSTSVSCSPNAVGAGAPTTCTATVRDASAGSASTPTGTVGFGSNGPGRFSDRDCTLSGSGASATCSVTFTPAPSAVGGTGARTITAAYGGDATHAESSGSETVTVLPSTSTRVSCSPDPVAVGQASTCTATVTTDPVGGAPLPPPTGRVTFASNGAGGFSQPECNLSPAGPGSASCSVTYTPSAVGTGAHTITASYGGDATHGASSGSQSVTVLRSTSMGVSCAPGTVAVATPSTCTATVSDTDAGAASTPTGSVGFATSGPGGFGAGSCTLSEASAGVASCSVSYTPAASGALRTDTITASYGGDSLHAGSSGTAPVRVQPTSRADCQHGGWRNYGFQNQGQCIQFATGGLGAPAPSKADCLHGGWRTLGFRNQGQCIQALNGGGPQARGKSR
jgi:large repetitive protein